MASTPLRIEGIAHGGDGVGTLPDGRKVFVPLTAPGDLVSIEGLELKGQHARARLAEVLEAGQERVAFGCPHAERCGGCQLQQISMGAQGEAKERAFYEALARIGGTPRDAVGDARAIVSSPSPFRYRIRARLHVRDGKLGYLRRGSHELEAVKECHLLVPELERLALAVGEALSRKPIPGLRDVELCIGADGQGAIALHPDPKAAPSWADKAPKIFDGIAGLRGIVALPPPAKPAAGRRAAPPGSGGPARKIFGDPVVARQAPLAPGVRLLGRPDAFAQANAEGNEALVRAAVEGLRVESGDEILELYCGAGNFTFALAGRAARVTAVEEAGISLELARRAAAEAKVGNVRFIAGDAGKVAEDFAREGRKFDLVLLDPPRAGARGLAESLALLAPRRIAYVSCDPATLARDVGALRALGYEALSAVPVDMFPQTYHVEGVVILERREGSWKPAS